MTVKDHTFSFSAGLVAGGLIVGLGAGMVKQYNVGTGGFLSSMFGVVSAIPSVTGNGTLPGEFRRASFLAGTALGMATSIFIGNKL